MKIDVIRAKALRRMRIALAAPKRSRLGREFLCELEANKSDDEAVFLLTNLIGDTCYGLAYLDEYKRANPGKRIVVMGSARYREFLESYDAIDELRLYDPESSLASKVGALIGSSSLSERALQRSIINGHSYFYKACRKSENPEVLYQARTHIFGFRDDAQISFHGLARACLGEREGGRAASARKVLLSPYSNSVISDSMDLFAAISGLVAGFGFEPYTNAVGDQDIVFGSRRFDAPLGDVCDEMSGFALVIGVRSGILDFLIPTGVPIFAIYPNKTERWRKMHSLQGWHGESAIREEAVSGAADIAKVLESLERFMVDELEIGGNKA